MIVSYFPIWPFCGSPVCPFLFPFNHCLPPMPRTYYCPSFILISLHPHGLLLSFSLSVRPSLSPSHPVPPLALSLSLLPEVSQQLAIFLPIPSSLLPAALSSGHAPFSFFAFWKPLACSWLFVGQSRIPSACPQLLSDYRASPPLSSPLFLLPLPQRPRPL